MDNAEIKKQIGKNLTRLRKANKKTQSEVAEHLGLKKSCVSAWENGVNSIDIVYIIKLSEFLNVSVNDIIKVTR